MTNTEEEQVENYPWRKNIAYVNILGWLFSSTASSFCHEAFALVAAATAAADDDDDDDDDDDLFFQGSCAGIPAAKQTATKGNSITNKGTYVLQEKQNT